MIEALHNRVNELRTKANLTQEELGKGVGVTRQTIIAIEKGNYTPSVSLALKISQFFSGASEDKKPLSVNDIFIITYEK